MKRIRGPLTFWLLLQMLLVGCDGRKKEDIPEVFCEVEVSVNWEGVKEMPDRIQVIFYPQETSSNPTLNNLPARGGKTKVKPGRYKILIYNCDNGEYEVKVRNKESYETIEAYSEPYTAIDEAKGMVWEPLPLYVAQEEMIIDETEQAKTLEIKPRLIPQTCSFEIRVKGLEYVKHVSGSVSGVASSYFLGLERCSAEECTIFIEMQKGDGKVKGKFMFFGIPDLNIRAASITQQITVVITRIDDSIQEENIDVTEIIEQIVENGNGDDEPGDNPGEDSEPDESIEVDEEIEVPYTPPPSGEGEGGFGGEVDDWGDEEEIILPMK